MSYDGFQELQNAIVLRAADDYRILLKKQLKNPGNKEIARKIRKLEREIHTPFFRALHDLILTGFSARSEMKYFLNKMRCKGENSCSVVVQHQIRKTQVPIVTPGVSTWSVTQN